MQQCTMTTRFAHSGSVDMFNATEGGEHDAAITPKTPANSTPKRFRLVFPRTALLCRQILKWWRGTCMHAMNAFNAATALVSLCIRCRDDAAETAMQLGMHPPMSSEKCAALASINKVSVHGHLQRQVMYQRHISGTTNASVTPWDTIEASIMCILTPTFVGRVLIEIVDAGLPIRCLICCIKKNLAQELSR